LTKPSSNQFYRTTQLDGLSALDADVYQQSFPAHYHDTYQITLPKRGVFKNKINDKLTHAIKDHISITHPGEVHATVCDEKTGHSFFTLYLPPTLFKSRVIVNQPSNHVYFHSVVSDRVLAKLLYKIKCHLASSNQTPSIELMVWQVIDRLIKYHQTSKEEENNLQYPFDLTQLSAHESQFCSEPFCLKTWSQQFGLNKFKFLRLFKIQTGMTPNQFLIFQRIQQSRSLLADGADLTDTALECGFYDLPHFHKHFKRIIGVTPRAFKQAHLLS